jgi:hypothetical protein
LIAALDEKLDDGDEPLSGSVVERALAAGTDPIHVDAHLHGDPRGLQSRLFVFTVIDRMPGGLHDSR